MQTTDDVRAKRFRQLLIAIQQVGRSYRRTFDDPATIYNLTKHYAIESAVAADLTPDQCETLLTAAAQASGL